MLPLPSLLAPLHPGLSISPDTETSNLRPNQLGSTITKLKFPKGFTITHQSPRILSIFLIFHHSQSLTFYRREPLRPQLCRRYFSTIYKHLPSYFFKYRTQISVFASKYSSGPVAIYLICTLNAHDREHAIIVFWQRIANFTSIEFINWFVKVSPTFHIVLLSPRFLVSLMLKWNKLEHYEQRWSSTGRSSNNVVGVAGSSQRRNLYWPIH